MDRAFGQQPTGQHLIVNTYGSAVLLHHEREMARSSQVVSEGIATHCFNYQVRVNTTGAFDIQRRTAIPVMPLRVAFEDGNGTLFHIDVTATSIVMPPRYRITHDELVQTYSLKPMPPFPGGFRIRLLASNVNRRIDLRYLNHSWVSVFIAARQIMAVRLQGEEMAEALYEVCSRVALQGVIHEGADYGLRSAPRARSRTATSGNPTPTQSRQASPNRKEERTVEVPRLVPFETGAYGPIQPTDSAPTSQADQSQSATDTFEMPRLIPLNIEETGTIPKNRASPNKATEQKVKAGPSGIQASPKLDRRKTRKVKAMAKMLVSEIATQWSDICNNMSSSEEEGEIHDEE